MHLFELTDSRPAPPANAAGRHVPEWVLGCFRRRSLTFFDGTEDDRTRVVWLQSHGLTADLRSESPASGATARLTGLADVRELPLAELLRLVRVEAGIGDTRWDGELMHWSSWDAFQTHAKWPEPGRLHRTGSCLVEFAPSGAYVEDWRFQPCAGRLIGLRMLDERDRTSGEVVHRGGGLVVCGRHAAFVRGRAEPLPDGHRLDDLVRTRACDAAWLERVFACDGSYAVADSSDDDFIVQLSTLPWREGQSLLSLEGFSLDTGSGFLLQRVEERGRPIERRFTIDTLEREFSGDVSTTAAPSAMDWWARERDTLLATGP
jgi:hypothetical protein